MARIGRDQQFAERGIGKNPFARLGNTMGRAWDRTSATQKATSALKFGALAAGAAAIPVALPASLVGMGIARAAVRRHSAMKNGTHGMAARQRHAQQMAAYNRALGAQQAQDSGALGGGSIAPATGGSTGGQSAAPAPRVDTMGQATVDATSGRTMGDAGTAGQAPRPPRMPYQHGPGGTAPTRRTAPTAPRAPQPVNGNVAGTAARVSAARRAARTGGAGRFPVGPSANGNSANGNSANGNSPVGPR